MQQSLTEFVPTPLKRVASTNGGEYKGPCPWCGGEDRFTVSPEKGESGLYICRQCGRGGDGVDFLRDWKGLGYRDALERFGINREGRRSENSSSLGSRAFRCEPGGRARASLKPPGAPWQKKARAFYKRCYRTLWSSGEGAQARAWLKERGFKRDTLQQAGLGFNPRVGREPRRAWGLPEKDRKKVYLPRGIVIPWVWREESGVTFWKLNVRRLGGEKPKYMQVAGKDEERGWSTNALYGAEKLSPGKPAIIAEGELDALTIEQEAGDLIAPVATGSTTGAQEERWIRRLSACSVVLVAFDRDEAGKKATRFWMDTLKRARVWQPALGDVNDIHQSGISVRAWVERGLEKHLGQRPNESEFATEQGEPSVNFAGQLTRYA